MRRNPPPFGPARRRDRNLAATLLFGLAVGLFVLLLGRHILADYRRSAQARADEAAASAQREAAAQRQREADCRAAAACWGERHLIAATVACERLAQTRALHTIRWPQGFAEQSFVAWEWRDAELGTLVYAGHADLQNGFGAWTPYRVGCLYDSAAHRATRIEFVPIAN